MDLLDDLFENKLRIFGFFCQLIEFGLNTMVLLGFILKFYLIQHGLYDQTYSTVIITYSSIYYSFLLVFSLIAVCKLRNENIFYNDDYP